MEKKENLWPKLVRKEVVDEDKTMIIHQYTKDYGSERYQAGSKRTRTVKGTKRGVKRGRPKRNVATTGTLADKLEQAFQKEGQNAVLVSATKGGMKILFEGHHFKYLFRRGENSIFQCCYNENNEQCLNRVVSRQNRVFHLDGEHNHFNQATDKSVTSVMFETTPEDFDNSVKEYTEEHKGTKLNEIDQFVEDVIVMSGDEDLVPKKGVSEKNIRTPEDFLSKDDSKQQDVNDFREKIKKRLQKALMGKKK